VRTHVINAADTGRPLDGVRHSVLRSVNYAVSLIVKCSRVRRKSRAANGRPWLTSHVRVHFVRMEANNYINCYQPPATTVAVLYVYTVANRCVIESDTIDFSVTSRLVWLGKFPNFQPRFTVYVSISIAGRRCDFVTLVSRISTSIR